MTSHSLPVSAFTPKVFETPEGRLAHWSTYGDRIAVVVGRSLRVLELESQQVTPYELNFDPQGLVATRSGIACCEKKRVTFFGAQMKVLDVERNKGGSSSTGSGAIPEDEYVVVPDEDVVRVIDNPQACPARSRTFSLLGRPTCETKVESTKVKFQTANGVYHGGLHSRWNEGPQVIMWGGVPTDQAHVDEVCNGATDLFDCGADIVVFTKNRVALCSQGREPELLEQSNAIKPKDFRSSNGALFKREVEALKVWRPSSSSPLVLEQKPSSLEACAWHRQGYLAMIVEDKIKVWQPSSEGFDEVAEFASPFSEFGAIRALDWVGNRLCAVSNAGQIAVFQQDHTPEKPAKAPSVFLGERFKGALTLLGLQLAAYLVYKVVTKGLPLRT